MTNTMIMKEYLVVVNPNAGIGKAQRDWPEISGLLNKHGFNYHAVYTEGPMHAIELIVDHVARGYRKVIVVGGDGTMNEVVNGVFTQKTVPTSEITLGMISVGTGNDWVRTYNIPMDYERAIEVLKKGQTIIQDAGTVSYFNSTQKLTRYFINMAGLGFDALVAQKTNADKSRGRGNPMLYLANLISSLFVYKSCGTKVVVNGTVVKEKIFSISIGIGKYNGGGMQQAPDAKTDDGLFDITLIKDISKLSVIASVRRLYNGTIKKHKRVLAMVGKHVIVESDQPILLETDGESLGHSPFEFNIVPKSIKVLVC